MSGVALEVRVGSTSRSFFRLLLAVVLGYIGALVTLGLAAVGLMFLWLLPRPWVQPGPFPIDGVWSLAADFVIALAVVFVAAWWIRRMAARAVHGPVSFGVVALAVALTGYVPAFLLEPAGFFLGILALPVMPWFIRRYAIGRTLPIPRVSWRVWLALGVVGLAVVGSYRIYHPFVATLASNSGEFTVRNSDWANMTILRVDGGWVGPTSGRIDRYALPYALGARARMEVYANAHPCVSHDVTITFSTLGRTATQRFTFTPDAPNYGSFSDLPDGAGCDEYPYVR